ncbi:MAG: hypothetical protein IT259_00145 [Saprospiraceae bacterium]|nr:hypothetical protein [Saprospiraceae bacterium]
MKRILLFSAFALLLSAGLWQCSPGTKYTPENMPSKQLHWGYGGGFAGQETSFVLLENGQIFRRNGAGLALQEVKGTKAKTAKNLFKTFDRDLKKYDFNHPGNVYSFVQQQEGSSIRRIAWGDDRFPVEQKAKDFFNQMNALVVE